MTPSKTAIDRGATLPDRALPAIVVAGALAAGAGCGFALLVPSPEAAVAFALLTALLVLVARRLSGSGTPWLKLAAIAWLAFAARFAVGAGLFAWSTTSGHRGFITGDDAAYSQLAWAFASWLRGTPIPDMAPPLWDGQAYLFGPFVFLTSLVYLVVGNSPLVGVVVNAFLASLSVVLLWDIARGLFSRSVANVVALVIAIEPANAVFSALLLKDSLGMALCMTCLWSAYRFYARPRYLWIVVSAAAIALMLGIHGYAAYVLLVATLAAALALNSGLSWPAKRLWLVTAALTCGGALLIGLTGGGAGLPELSFRSLESVRVSMAANAHTAFATDTSAFAEQNLGTATSAPVPAEAGAGTLTPGWGWTVAPVPGVVRGFVLFAVVAGAGWLLSRYGRDRRIATAALALVGGCFLILLFGRLGTLIANSSSEAAAFARTVAYLPRGASYVLFAPFPWTVRRLLDLPTIPYALFWYTLLAAASFTVAFERARRRDLLPIVLFAVGTFVIFVLAEGNVGTLFRHRVMLTEPAIVLIAVPALLAGGGWLSVRMRRPARTSERLVQRPADGSLSPRRSWPIRPLDDQRGVQPVDRRDQI